jgi:hypothetical protein
VTEQVWPYPVIDPTANQIILCVGRKGSGKSAAAREHFRGWPGADRLVVDVNGDADPGEDLDAVVLHGPLVQLPPRRDPKIPDTYRWIADPQAESFYEDIDKALGAGLFPRDRKVVMWVDEAGEAFRANRTGPNGRTWLHQSRHFNASGLLCCPRPKGIDPLAVAQADRVLMFDVPHPLDRARLAEGIGISPAKLDEVMDETRRRGPFWSTLYHATEHRLYRIPPFELT